MIQITFSDSTIADLRARIDTIMAGPPADITSALLTLFEHVASEGYASAMLSEPSGPENVEWAEKILGILLSREPADRPRGLVQLMDRVAALRDESNASLLFAEADRRERAAHTFPESATPLRGAAEAFRFGAALITARPK